MVNKEGLSRRIAQNKNTTFGNDKSRVVEENSAEVLGDMSQIQSVPLHRATQSFRHGHITNEEKVIKNLDDDHDSIPSSCIKKVEGDNQRSNNILLIPESWPLIVLEEISYQNLKVSIQIMKKRDNGEKDYIPVNYWVVDIYGTSYKLQKRFVLRKG